METVSVHQPGSSAVTSEKLQHALGSMSMATRAVHSDDFFSPHRAIAPGLQVAVNYRYARNPDDLVPMENHDVSTTTKNTKCEYAFTFSSRMHQTTRMCIHVKLLRTRAVSKASCLISSAARL